MLRTDDIWDDDDVEEEDVKAHADEVAGRERPEHEVLHRQAVGAETVYFGMGDMDPGTASCGEYLVRVKMPGEKLPAVDLEVKPEGMRVRSQK